MRYVIQAMLVVVGLIHLLPMSGVLGAERLAALYSIPFNEPNLQILMRHRAVLFGLLAGFLIGAAFHPSLQWLAFAMGYASVLSFLLLAWSVGGCNEGVRRVVLADLVALFCLLVGSICLLASSSRICFF